ncbi:MAG: hypothetical protein AB1813_17005 [Verrucomicrobiota bacterium]
MSRLKIFLRALPSSYPSAFPRQQRRWLSIRSGKRIADRQGRFDQEQTIELTFDATQFYI